MSCTVTRLSILLIQLHSMQFQITINAYCAVTETMLNDVSVISEILTPCITFRILVYAYKSRCAFVLAFLDTAVGKPRGFTPNLFRGSYSHAHWITSGAAAIHIYKYATS